MMNQRAIVYAPNMKSLFWACKHFRLGEFEIITNDEKIEKQFWGVIPKILNIKKPNGNKLNDLKKHRNELKKIAEGIANRNIYFGIRGFDVFGLYFLKLLTHKNKVFFIEELDNNWNKASFWELTNPSAKKYFIDKAILFYILGISFDLFKLNQKNFFLGFTLERCLNIFEKSNLPEPSEDIFLNNVNHLKETFNIPTCDVLIVDERKNMVGQFDKKPLSDFLKWLKEHNVKVIIKAKPKNVLTNVNFDFFSIFKDDLPSEFFIGNVKILIGMHSNSLHSFRKHSKVISLIEFSDYYSEEYRMKIYDNILSKTDELIFPKTIEELIIEVKDSINI